MSQRERETRVSLDGRLSEGQLEIVRRRVIGQLIGRAEDLRLLNTYSDPKREIKEVAALARLAFWLDYGEILVPDRIARDLMLRLAAEAEDHTEREGIRERYEAATAEQDALHGFAAALSEHPSASVGARPSPGSATEPGDVEKHERDRR